jgi:hypothetical protein
MDRPGGAFWADRSGRERKRAVHRTACSWISMPAVLGEEPSGSRKITGGSRVWPTHGPRDPRALTRTLPISGYHFGLTTPGGSPRLPGLRMGCRMQRPATDKPASIWPVRRQFSADLLLTLDVPALDRSYTSRDGTDNGEWSRGPVTCSVLMTQPVSKASSNPAEPAG